MSEKVLDQKMLERLDALLTALDHTDFDELPEALQDDCRDIAEPLNAAQHDEFYPGMPWKSLTAKQRATASARFMFAELSDFVGSLLDPDSNGGLLREGVEEVRRLGKQS